MPASPLTDGSWPGLPLLQCDMDPGLYRLHAEVSVLILRTEPGSIVEVAEEDGHCIQFRQAPLRFDLFTSGLHMDAVSDRRGTRSLVIALPPEWLVADGSGLDGAPLRPRFQFGDRQLWRLAWRLIMHYRNGGPLGSVYSEAVSRTLVDRLAGLQIEAEARAPDSVELEPEARRLVELLVDANLQQPLSVATMAQMVGMGVVRFAREFKATLGATPHQYVQKRRIALACELLAGTDASLAQIALETGFASHAHFSAAFRASMDQTPSTYRKSQARPRAARPRTVS